MSLTIHLSAEAARLSDEIDRLQEALSEQIKKDFPLGATFDFHMTQGVVRGVVQYAGLDHNGSCHVGFVNVKTGKQRAFFPTFCESVLISLPAPYEVGAIIHDPEDGLRKRIVEIRDDGALVMEPAEAGTPNAGGAL